MFSVFRSESKHLHKKESLSCLCSLFCLFGSVSFFLKVFCLFFFIKDSIFGIFCLYCVHKKKYIYHSFLFVNTDVSQATFPASFAHWSTWFSNFAAFFLLFWFHVKSHERYEVTYATLLSLCIADSDLRRPCRKWLESSERRMRYFQKKFTGSK